MSAAMVLPMVWATADPLPEMIDWRQIFEDKQPRPTVRGLAFYRRYTEAILRRYVSMSMEAGRAPSLLGREMFRGKVTSYRVHSFEDVVIFLHDVEKCLAKLDIEQREMVESSRLTGVFAGGGSHHDGAGDHHCGPAVHTCLGSVDQGAD